MPAVTRRAGARPAQPGANAAGGATGAPGKGKDAGAGAVDGALALPLPLPSPPLQSVSSGALPPQEQRGATGQQQPRRRQQTSRWLTCTTCRSNKVKCDGLFPCSRCWDRVCFCCRPQMDSFAVSGGGGWGPQTASWEGKEEVERPPSSDGEDASSAASAPPAPPGLPGQLTTPPYIHLVFLRSQPQASAQGFLAAFSALHAQGRVDRGKVVRVLRIWQARSLLCGVDISYGIIPVLARVVGVSAAELEGLEEVKTHQSPAGVAEASEALWDSPFFQLSDQGHTATLVSSTDGVRLRQASNAAFVRMFLHAGDFLQESIQRRTLQMLLFSSLLHPQDRWLWFEAWARALLGVDPEAPGPEDAAGERGSSFFVKTIDHAGRIRLCIMQVLPLPARLNPATGLVEHGMVARLEVAPPSKHLTDRPEMSTATFKKQLAASAPPASITGRLRKRKKEPKEGKPPQQQQPQAPPPSVAALPSSLTTLPVPDISAEDRRRLLPPISPPRGGGGGCCGGHGGGRTGAASPSTSSSGGSPLAAARARPRRRCAAAGEEEPGEATNKEESEAVKAEVEDETLEGQRAVIMSSLFARTSFTQRAVLRAFRRAFQGGGGEGKDKSRSSASSLASSSSSRGGGKQQQKSEAGGGGRLSRARAAAQAVRRSLRGRKGPAAAEEEGEGAAAAGSKEEDGPSGPAPPTPDSTGPEAAGWWAEGGAGGGGGGCCGARPCARSPPPLPQLPRPPPVVGSAGLHAYAPPSMSPTQQAFFLAAAAGGAQGGQQPPPPPPQQQQHSDPMALPGWPPMGPGGEEAGGMLPLLSLGEDEADFLLLQVFAEEEEEEEEQQEHNQQQQQHHHHQPPSSSQS